MLIRRNVFTCTPGFGIDIRLPSSDDVAVGNSAIVVMLRGCEKDVDTRGFGGADEEWAAATDVPTKAGEERELWRTMRTIEELSIRVIGSVDGSIKVEEEVLGWVK